MIVPATAALVLGWMATLQLMAVYRGWRLIRQFPNNSGLHRGIRVDLLGAAVLGGGTVVFIYYTIQAWS